MRFEAGSNKALGRPRQYGETLSKNIVISDSYRTWSFGVGKKIQQMYENM
jgi:hypothetical protein